MRLANDRLNNNASTQQLSLHITGINHDIAWGLLYFNFSVSVHDNISDYCLSNAMHGIGQIL